MADEEHRAAQREAWKRKFPALNEEELKIFQQISATDEQLETFNENAKGPLKAKQGKLTMSTNGAIKDGQRKTFNLLLLGKTGSGKSATGNLIVGRSAFTESMKSVSQTKTIGVAHCDVDGASVVVIDTPGFNDTNAPPDEIITEMTKVVDIFKEGIHGVLFVYSLGNPRYTAEEQESFQQIQEGVLGDGFINNCFVILTHGEDLVKNQSLQQYLEAETREGSLLGKLLETLEQRVIVVDNSDTTEYGRQLQREQVVRMVAERSNIPCQPAIFKKFLDNQREVTNNVPAIYRPHVSDMERVVSDQYVGMPHQQIVSMSVRDMRDIMEMMVTAIVSSQERQMDIQREMIGQQATMNSQMMDELRGIAETLHDAYIERLTDEKNRREVKKFSIPLLGTVVGGVKKAWNWLTG